MATATATHNDAAAERTAEQAVVVKEEEAVAKTSVPAAAEGLEPESEDLTAASSDRCSSSSSISVPHVEEEDKAKIKFEEPMVVEDVEMECDEAAEDAFGPSDEDEDDAQRTDLGDHLAPSDATGDAYQYHAGFETAPVREYPEEYAKYQIPEKEAAILSSGVALSPMWGGKRKRSAETPADASMASHSGGARIVVDGIDMGKPLAVTTKRKGSSDFLRKGQWTPTEERLARLLIEAFEEGYLPIYTGIRLRGYLAVQLQCDPMRVSKKLCAGAIDGKKVPKNYGQKKFRLRKKLLWDREEAGRILATLERLTKELWCETGIAPPQYLTLSTTRNADDELSPSSADRTQPSPVKKLSPPANKSKKQKNGVVFPIIYLNLSKKLKQGQVGGSSGGSQSGSNASASFTYENVFRQYGVDAPYVQNPDGSIQVVSFTAHQNDSDASSTSSSDVQAVKVDGESLQAAYELLNLHQLCTSPSGSSRSSTPTPGYAEEGHHAQKQKQQHQQQQLQENIGEKTQACSSIASTAQSSSVVPIRPAPAKPTILRQHAPTVSS